MYPLKGNSFELKKRSNVLDDKSCSKKGEGNDKFRRWEYWGFECYFLMHYTGDYTVFVPFAHRGAKNQKNPFIRSAPHIKEKVFSNTYAWFYLQHYYTKCSHTMYIHSVCIQCTRFLAMLH